VEAQDPELQHALEEAVVQRVGQASEPYQRGKDGPDQAQGQAQEQPRQARSHGDADQNQGVVHPAHVDSAGQRRAQVGARVRRDQLTQQRQ
jgi:hypothetical protein